MMLAQLGALATTILLPFLCIQCISSRAPLIQQNLSLAAASALEKAPVPGVKVLADGRDLVLQGTVENEASRLNAGQLVLALPGVRTLDNQLVVASSAAAVQNRLNEILLNKKIEFKTAKDIILPQSLPVLDEALAVLRLAPDLTITVNGHTDSRGIPASNKKLSARRAAAVAAWFEEHGIAASRLSSAGYGSERPIDSNATAAGRARNRRVEIIASGKPPAEGR